MLTHQVGEGHLIAIFRARQGVVRSLHSALFPLDQLICPGSLAITRARRPGNAKIFSFNTAPRA
jgi:hypothetical protein